MAKQTTINLIAILGCIHLGDDVHVPGGPAFPCEAKEAKRLIGLGVAAPEKPADATEKPADASNKSQVASELLAAIAAVETAEALQALMPEEDPGPEIAAAFEARMAELEEPHH